VHSLSRRLLLSLFVPLVAFFGVTMVVLDASFRDVAQRSLRDSLDAQIVALIAAAEQQPDGSFEPAAQSPGLETRLATPGSGLYAQIQSTEAGDVPWRSASAAGTFIDFGAGVTAGERRYFPSRAQDGSQLEIASRGISFEDEKHVRRNLTFSVASTLTRYNEQLWRFRRELFGGFFVLTLVLLATLGFVMRWVLSPMRRLEKEINAVEEGTRESLGDGYPRELSGVATNLNTLLIGERNRLARYRDSLGNLAHGLKTPLAIMRTTMHGLSADQSRVLGGEIDRMTAIVEHQLKRAASGGALLGQAPLEIEPLLVDLRAAMMQVYMRKDLSISVSVQPNAQFVGDRGDLTELLGNLLDNACKWCKERVKVDVTLDSAAGPKQRLRIDIDDDGPGISEGDRARVLERGVRADEKVPGHGLGLAMVRETVDLYGGRLAIEKSTLGGARISLSLPGR
jgi:two-component system, OmpR family, sensor histidine kinase PhoQ